MAADDLEVGERGVDEKFGYAAATTMGGNLFQAFPLISPHDHPHSRSTFRGKSNRAFFICYTRARPHLPAQGARACCLPHDPQALSQTGKPGLFSVESTY